MIKKFFGKGDVFINIKSPTNIQGKGYETGDTIAFFENVDVILDYNMTHSEASDRRRQLSYTEANPYSLTISGVPNSVDLERLMYKGYTEKKVRYKKIKTIKFSKLTEYLTEDLIPVKINAFGDDKQVEFLYNSENNEIIFEEEYKTLRLILEYEEEGKEYDFDRPNLGYLEIEATIEGRFGNQDGIFAVTLPAADLVTEPMTVLTEESNYSTTLGFALVGNNKPVMKYVE